MLRDAAPRNGGFERASQRKRDLALGIALLCAAPALGVLLIFLYTELRAYSHARNDYILSVLILKQQVGLLRKCDLAGVNELPIENAL